MFIFKKPFINQMCNWSVKSYLIYKTRNINGILKPQRRGSASSYGSNYISVKDPSNINNNKTGQNIRSKCLETLGNRHSRKGCDSEKTEAHQMSARAFCLRTANNTGKYPRILHSCWAEEAAELSGICGAR